MEISTSNENSRSPPLGDDQYSSVFLSAPMHSLVTARTKSYQIGFNIIAQSAPRLNVMDLKIFHASARLTTPSISVQDFTAKLTICFRIKPQAGAF
jgi:hypothetical protein